MTIKMYGLDHPIDCCCDYHYYLSRVEEVEAIEIREEYPEF